MVVGNKVRDRSTTSSVRGSSQTHASSAVARHGKFAAGAPRRDAGTCWPKPPRRGRMGVRADAVRSKRGNKHHAGTPACFKNPQARRLRASQPSASRPPSTRERGRPAAWAIAHSLALPAAEVRRRRSTACRRWQAWVCPPAFRCRANARRLPATLRPRAATSAPHGRAGGAASGPASDPPAPRRRGGAQRRRSLRPGRARRPARVSASGSSPPIFGGSTARRIHRFACGRRLRPSRESTRRDRIGARPVTQTPSPRSPTHPWRTSHRNSSQGRAVSAPEQRRAGVRQDTGCRAEHAGYG